MSKQMLELADELESIRKRGHFPNDSLIDDVVETLRSSAGSETPVPFTPKPLDFFSQNVDAWGAVEWFDRLAKAIRQQDVAVVAGDEITMETCRNVAASSAMRLVRDYEQQVRAALRIEPQTSAVSAQPYGWHAAANGLFSVDPRCAEVWRHHMGLDVTPVYTHSAPDTVPQASVDSATVMDARDRIAELIADLQGEHEIMCGLPFEPAAWKIEVSASDLQAVIGGSASTIRTSAQDAPAGKHASDCAVYNAPACEPGPCDCGAESQTAPSRDRPVGYNQLVNFSELKLLIDEYDPQNSDWNFRKGVLLDILVRLWPTNVIPQTAPTRAAVDTGIASWRLLPGNILEKLDGAWNEDFKANLMHYCDLAAQEIRKAWAEADAAHAEVVQTQDELGRLLHAAEQSQAESEQ